MVLRPIVGRADVEEPRWALDGMLAHVEAGISHDAHQAGSVSRRNKRRLALTMRAMFSTAVRVLPQPRPVMISQTNHEKRARFGEAVAVDAFGLARWRRALKRAFSVIAQVAADLAAKHPIGPASVHEDDGQQEHGANKEEGLSCLRGGGVP